MTGALDWQWAQLSQKVPILMSSMTRAASAYSLAMRSTQEAILLLETRARIERSIASKQYQRTRREGGLQLVGSFWLCARTRNG